MSSEMKKPCVVLGVTGGIAVYKACELLRLLQKRGIDVFVVMTQNACRFVAPLTFETLSGHPVAVDTFDRPQTWEVEHIALAKRADLFLLAPATANIMGKMACGIADDMLSTTVMATRAPVLVAPAMNTGMWENATVQQNVKTLRARGVEIVAPVSGHLACGDNGAGKLEDVAVIAERACELLFAKKDMEGLRVMVTAGPSREALDPVRYISNRSSGKMGYAIAGRAAMRGAEVTLVSGPTALDTPKGVNRVDIRSARDMYDAVLSRAAQQDFIIKAAAVGDYRPAETADEKLKKGDGELNIRLARNPDILAALGADKRPGQLLCGFAMETQNLLDNAESKLRRKNCDMLVANSLRDKGAGFGTDTNIATLLFADGHREQPSIMSKADLADLILDRLLGMSRR